MRDKKNDCFDRTTRMFAVNSFSQVGFKKLRSGGPFGFGMEFFQIYRPGIAESAAETIMNFLDGILDRALVGNLHTYALGMLTRIARVEFGFKRGTAHVAFIKNLIGIISSS